MNTLVLPMVAEEQQKDRRREAEHGRLVRSIDAVASTRERPRMFLFRELLRLTLRSAFITRLPRLART
jgi:hypothetical protein